MASIQRIDRENKYEYMDKIATADESMYVIQRLRLRGDKSDYAFADKDFVVESFQAVATHFGKEARFVEMTGSEINTMVGSTVFYGAQCATVFLIGFA